MSQSLRSLPGSVGRASAAGSARRCRACGQTGHYRNNRRCPQYTATPSTAVVPPRMGATRRGSGPQRSSSGPHFRELEPGFFQFECVDSVVDKVLSPEAQRIVAAGRCH